jgi:transcriptional regulator with XRE-family HTH domain
MTKQGGWPATGFGRRLKEVREARGLSQQQLADQAGLHLMTVSKLERGVQEPAWPLVLALASALGASCEDFRGAPSPPTSAEKPARPRGRPPKAPGEQPVPKRPRGRPRKAT